jgi:hypothetical protein
VVIEMELRASGEDYLEAVLILGQRMGQVRAIDVSQYLGCAKTSVSHGLRLLHQGGVLFGSAGLKLLSSRDAKKAYTHATLLTRNVSRALSVLMVDFSCALKLAMPLAVLSAMREAKGRLCGGGAGQWPYSHHDRG